LSSQPSVSETTLDVERNPPQLASIGWALRRTALWLLILFGMVTVGMWLFWASIDPDEAVAGGSPAAATTAESAPAQR
jgi:hypothetical protein